MKVLLLGEYGVLNGGERSCLAMVRRLAGKQIDFSAAVPCPSPFADNLGKLNCKLLPLKLRTNSGQKLQQAEIRAQVNEIVSVSRPDIVHANSLSMSRTLGPLTLGMHIKKLGHFRDIIKLSRQMISDLNQLDSIIAVSNATRDFHVDQGIDPMKIATVYNGVDTQQFESSVNAVQIRNEFNLKNDDWLFVFIGQIGLRKGVDTLINAFLDHSQRIGNTHLLIVGQRNSQKQESIEFESALHHEVCNSRHANRIHFAGTRNDVPDLLSACNGLVHCARQEPLGRVLLESCAAGIPVIATNVGGTSEIFEESKPHGAILVEPDNVMQISTAISELAHNPAIASEFGARNRQIAIARFDADHAARNLLDIYRELKR